MSAEQPDEISRRSALKQAALGGAGLIATSVLPVGGSNQARAEVELVVAKDRWLTERASCVSGNRLLTAIVGEPVRTKARQIYRPSSAGEIAELIRSLPAGTPVATVCGGHESS
ncbi:MAG: twin-arginine translocation signal domain-containing protein, partial [Pirellulaceae bacterium]